MSLPKTETFSTNGDLGSTYTNWANTNGVKVSAYLNNVYPGDSGANADGFAYWAGDTFSNDQYAQLVITTTAGDKQLGPAVRVSNSANTGYAARVNFTAGLELVKVVAGSVTSLGTYALNSGATYKIEASGTTISVKENGVTRISVTDSAISSGYGGIYAFGDDGNPAGSSFEAGNLGGGPSNAPRMYHLTQQGIS